MSTKQGHATTGPLSTCALTVPKGRTKCYSRLPVLQTGRLSTRGVAARFHADLCTLGPGRDGPHVQLLLSDPRWGYTPALRRAVVLGRGQASSQGWP